METIEFKQIENGIEKVFFNLVSVDSSITINTEFSLKVNQEDTKILKLNCLLSMLKDDNEDTFLEIESYGIYETNNQDGGITLDKIENALELMEDLIPFVNENLSFITMRGLGDSIEIPTPLSREIKDPSAN